MRRGSPHVCRRAHIQCWLRHSLRRGRRRPPHPRRAPDPSCCRPASRNESRFHTTINSLSSATPPLPGVVLGAVSFDAPAEVFVALCDLGFRYEQWTPPRTSTRRLASTPRRRYLRSPRSCPTSASSPSRSGPSSSSSPELRSRPMVRTSALSMALGNLHISNPLSPWLRIAGRLHCPACLGRSDPPGVG